MDKSSMFANKLYTILQRKERNDKVASRDIYDVRFFFKNHREINKELLKERSSKNILEYLKFIKEFIQKNFNKNNLLLGLGELVNEKQKHFIKNKLISELSSQIDFFTFNN
jgi:lipoate synthase